MAPEARPVESTGTKLARPRADVDARIIDRSVNPCDDFYRFACGGWLASATIPPDRPAWSRSFSEINERNLALLRDVLTLYAAGATGGDHDARKLGDLYGACVDESTAETTSLATLVDELRPIDELTAWPSVSTRDARAHFASMVADLQLQGVTALFQFGSQQDFADAREVIGAADQGGLGLPDRDYYLRTDEKSLAILDAYRRHVGKMFELTGVSGTEASRRADQVVRLETALARSSMPRVEHRDPYRIDHRIDRSGLARVAPHFDWDAYFRGLGYPAIQAINVLTPEFFAQLDRTLFQTAAGDLRSYLAWHVIEAAAPALGPSFVEESFRFRARNLTGEAQILPRWKRCLAVADVAMGQALGRAFVSAAFGADGRKAAQQLLAAIEAQFGTTLRDLAWMDSPTRAEAVRKLHHVYDQIGYPSRWRDYGALAIDRSNDLANRFRAAVFESKRDLAKIGKPVDRSDWSMSPQTVNAYYDQSTNEMVFPAGILQAPFFAVDAPAALNDGAIGVVMGHELTHGFDDQGRKFDADGDLRDWWTAAVKDDFERRVQCVVHQFDAYPVSGGLHVNGELTAGEDIADLGGLRTAYAVFRAGEPSQRPGVERDGLTPQQRFFVAFAQSWCTLRRDEYARMLVTVDPHAPPEYRVNGAVSNVAAFQDAFSCPDNAPMAPAHRCQVW